MRDRASLQLPPFARCHTLFTDKTRTLSRSFKTRAAIAAVGLAP